MILREATHFTANGPAEFASRDNMLHKNDQYLPSTKTTLRNPFNNNAAIVS